VAWVVCLLVAGAIGTVVLLVVAYVAITAFAEGVTSSLVRLIGTRGIALVLGVPMIPFAAWGLLRVMRGKSDPNMTPRQVLLGVVVIGLVGAMGAGLVIYGVAGDASPRPTGF
jgi:hypothetical protein